MCDRFGNVAGLSQMVGEHDLSLSSGVFFKAVSGSTPSPESSMCACMHWLTPTMPTMCPKRVYTFPKSGGAWFASCFHLFLNFFLMYKNLILTTNCVNLSCYEKFNFGNCVFVKRFDERHDECSSGHKRLHERSSDWH